MAIRKELEQQRAAGTYRIIKGAPPNRAKVISSRWVLRPKPNADGTVKRKARLVIRGFEQTYGVNYFETFAPVLRHTTLRILCAWAAYLSLEIDQIDITTAFLNSTLEETIYMEVL